MRGRRSSALFRDPEENLTASGGLQVGQLLDEQGQFGFRPKQHPSNVMKQSRTLRSGLGGLCFLHLHSFK